MNITGKLDNHISSKDLILHIIGIIGTSGGTGYTIEYAGECINNMSIEARMTICNMTIEAGAKSGLIGFDDKTFNYLLDKPYTPPKKYFSDAQKYWESLVSDTDAIFDKEIDINANEVLPQVTWGTSPEMTTNVNGQLPDPDEESDVNKREYMKRALEYMDLKPKQEIQSIKIDKVFIGSCTNSRIEDLREAARVLEGQKINKSLKQAIAVPGSGLVKKQAEDEGLDKIFIKSGFEWRDPGCSMCLGMNDDSLLPYERCASTSNRNFEGRQGDKGRTHLVSPSMAAVAAIKGHFTNVVDFVNEK
ncbi:MAG: hypothetical protein CMD73_03565 [Gammaproteobacteria bacterium]|nr:hypothetical protein [Gammaproteobacteria bacterium]